MRASPIIAGVALLIVAIARPQGLPVGAADPGAVARSRRCIAYHAQQARAVVAARADATTTASTCEASRARRGSTSRPSSTADDRWLPPDNVQFDPEPRIAHRTSPTNIAMSLLATLSAHDLGFIDADALVDAPRSDADHDRSARALRRPPAQLVRHADADAAAAEIRVDGRQRQLSPRRC